jgi:hypothetical protein
VRRKLRQAILRGVLPSLLALPLIPFAPGAAAIVVICAFTGTAIALAEIVIATSVRGRLRLALTLLAGVIAYVAAALQSVYADGVFTNRNLAGGLRHLEKLLESPPQDWTPVAFVLVCAGIGHALTVFCVANAGTRQRYTPVDEWKSVACLSLVVGIATALGGPGPGLRQAVGALVFAVTASYLIFCASTGLTLVTVLCDEAERSFWPLTPEESEDNESAYGGTATTRITPAAGSRDTAGRVP